jgi:vitamin B12 transporter
VTYRTSLLYALHDAGLSLKANLGTGYKDPSLYELYSSYGNVNLKPETSLGYDAGAGENLFGGLMTLEAVYFQNNFTNIILFDTSQNYYTNETSVLTRGVEASLKIRPAGFLEFGLSYTYTFAVNPESGATALFIPDNKAACRISVYPAGWMFFNIEFMYTGKRYDITGSGSDILMTDYSLVNLNFRADLGRFEVYARIDNLFNLNYQDIYGYNTGGFMFNTGITVKL